MSLRDAIRYFTEETHIMPCLSISCGTKDRALHERGGVINRQGTPLAEDSLFDLASLTKLFTGLLVMCLREEGRLDLARPVTAYAPQYAQLDGVTVDQVLGFEVALTTPQRVDTQPTREEGLRQLHAIHAGPVTGRAYSDMHAMVLKEIIEGAAQARWEALLHEKILHPLGMKDTFSLVPETERYRCVSCDGEHRIERGRYILRSTEAGMPHDPKAHLLWPEAAGHAGLFSTEGDMTRLCQGLLRYEVLSRESLLFMARNRTGYRRPDGSWTQFLGSQCYVKHPQQYYSEIPLYESDRAIGLSGFTGHHLSVDVETGVFALFLGNRVLDRLTVCVPEEGKKITDYGLNPDGTGCVLWPDGSHVWSSVDYVHHKDAHLHAEVANALGLPRWHSAGSEWP